MGKFIKPISLQYKPPRSDFRVEGSVGRRNAYNWQFRNKRRI